MTPSNFTKYRFLCGLTSVRIQLTKVGKVTLTASSQCKQYAEGSLLNFSLITDQWRRCFEVCSRNAQPVCGSNNITYMNDCFLVSQT